MKTYDVEKDALVMYVKASSVDFWAEHWKNGITKEDIQNGEKNYWYKKITKNFLSRGRRILDGGCGIGQNVYGLDAWGYEGHGIDYASETIEAVKKLEPSLRISCRDVRKTDFSDGFFDGYWLLGVIEHFWDGYAEIVIEARRILKPGGYFFVTFPWLSPLRRLKILFRVYPRCTGRCEQADDFYQFFLSQKSVVQNVSSHGFELVHAEAYDAVKGIKDETPILRPILQALYNGKGTPSRLARFIVSFLFRAFAGHMRLCVFKKLSG